MVALDVVASVFDLIMMLKLLRCFVVCRFLGLIFYVILPRAVCQRSFLFICDQKKDVFWAFDWVVLFYKLVYKTKRSAVIG